MTPRLELVDELSLIAITAISLTRSMTYLELAADRLRTAGDTEGELCLRSAHADLQDTLQALEPFEREPRS